MTLQDCIDKVDKVKINPYDNETKTEWINTIEGQIQREVLQIPLEEEVVQYNYDTDSGKELIVKEPYCVIYEDYIKAMIDYSNLEFDKYNNSITMFNSHYSDFAKWYIRNYKPKDKPSINYSLDRIGWWR